MRERGSEKLFLSYSGFPPFCLFFWIEMLKAHIANTFFEWELEETPHCSLIEGFSQHPIFRQLQFLPVVYAGAGEGILIADVPNEEYAKRMQPWEVFSLLRPSFPKQMEIESWGPSGLIAAFAKKHKLLYEIPDLALVRRINSKQFSFENAPKLSHATLLSDEVQTKEWLASFPGKKVLKTCYGVSGKGHLIIDGPSFPWEKIAAFLMREWSAKLPVIAEPWVDRLLDFSTQWLIHKNKEVTYIGATLCENDSKGHYRSNTVGEEKELFGTYFAHLQEHLKYVHPLLSYIAELGFFGNLGIDAMVYTLLDEPKLHPIVEINARKTMGWAALMHQRRDHPKCKVRFSFAPNHTGLLPQSVTGQNGKEVLFKRNLAIDVYN